METIYCILGIFVVFALITLMGQPDKMCELLNKKNDAVLEEKEKLNIGCYATFIYFWFLLGLFTSQWFLCAAYLAFGLVESALKRLVHYHWTPIRLFWGLTCDAIVVIAVICNSQWLHIDLYQKFISLF